MSIVKLYDKDGFCFQQAQYTCGPTVLLNILNEKGDTSHSEESIASVCHATAEAGTPPDNLVNAAEEIGLRIIDVKQNGTIDEIEKRIDNQEIIVINYFYAFSGEGHYAQVVEYDEKALYLKDPIAGYMRVRRVDFAKNWHNRDSSNNGWYVAIK